MAIKSSKSTKYAEILGLEYLDENGKKIPVVMGSYGIGPGRVMGSVVELFHDERGMIWPESIAPFKVHLLSLPGGEEESDKVYSSLQRDGIKVLYDDRANVSPGEKLVDADLFGIPWRVVVSEKTVAVDSVEVKKRNEEKAELIKQKDIAKFLAKNT